jgi:hypothetical protein
MTGTAALGISASTLHSNMSLMHKRLDDAPSEPTEMEKACLTSVDILVIEETGMLGKRTLPLIDQRLKLNRAVRNPHNAAKPFGGMHIIFAGDFMQNPPIMQKPLYSTVCDESDENDNARTDETRSLDTMGTYLWGCINTVILLDRSIRAQGDPLFSELLLRMRSNQMTREDERHLNSRVISERVQPPPGTAVLIYRNGIKDYINDRAIQSVATNKSAKNADNHLVKVFRNKAIFSPNTKNSPVLTPAQLHLLYTRPPITKNKNLAVLDVYIGMPCMITQNLGVLKHGIANGTEAVVFDIIFDDKDTTDIESHTDANGAVHHCHKMHHLPRVILVRLENPIFGSAFAPLPPGVYPVFPQSNLPFYEKSRTQRGTLCFKQICKITQFPLVPRFSMTGHKAQGQTRQSIIIAEPNYMHTSAMWLYTAISRVTSLQGLYLTEEMLHLIKRMQFPKYLMTYVHEILPAQNKVTLNALHKKLEAVYHHLHE